MADRGHYRAFKHSPLEVQDFGPCEPWLAELHAQWWDAHPELKQQPGEDTNAWNLRCMQWCYAHGFARMTGVQQTTKANAQESEHVSDWQHWGNDAGDAPAVVIDVDMQRERVPGEDDDLE